MTATGGRRIDGLDGLLTEVPSGLPDLPPASEIPDLSETLLQKPGFSPNSDEIFHTRRKAWNQDRPQDIPRCDLRPKASFVFRFPTFGIHTQYDRTLFGPTFEEIKADDDRAAQLADQLAALIRKTIGQNPDPRDWVIVTAPKRRHKTRNFATLMAAAIARDLRLDFVEDLVGCDSRQRVGAVFHLIKDLPPQRNVIAVDDIVTTGSTMQSIRNLLAENGRNAVFFAAINNRLHKT